jgi:hypothetical protein
MHAGASATSALSSVTFMQQVCSVLNLSATVLTDVGVTTYSIPRLKSSAECDLGGDKLQLATALNCSLKFGFRSSSILCGGFESEPGFAMRLTKVCLLS